MTAIENIRRDLREASYLRYADKPFAGAVHDFTKPMVERLKSRQYTGPYYYSPATPGGGRGFYQSSKGLYCASHGSTFDLRLEDANDHLTGRLSQINGYYTDDTFEGDTLQPIVARLPHGRGFLAGWTMGRGMCASIELDIYETIEDAARAAHSLAESDAEKEQEYQARERAKLESEESQD